VAQKDMSVNYINAISELPQHFVLQLRNFFENYKKLEHKTVKVEDFQDIHTAKAIIEQAIKDYRGKFIK